MVFDLYEKPDFHIHSDFSDGTDSVPELLEKLREEKVDIFALTDHDTFEGCRVMQGLLQPGDPRFLNGVELSCRDEFGKYHMLGFGFAMENSPIGEIVEKTHASRVEKAKGRLVFLKEKYGIVFPEEDVEALFLLVNPCRPHFVDLLMKHGYVENSADGFRIMAEYWEREWNPTPAEAIRCIRESGGLAVLAHGTRSDGRIFLSKTQIATRVERLKKEGLQGLESYYAVYAEEEKATLLDLAEQFDLLVTAGSDYHGTHKVNALGYTFGAEQKRMAPFYHAIAEKLI